ncbi:MAG: chlorophyll synthesis pathway protein BchC [Pseudomonadota bacterium]
MHTTAVLLEGAEKLRLETLELDRPGVEDVVVEVRHSGISTGTEKLLWTAAMPPFPGMGYPLVPGYEAAGEVVEAGAESGFKTGDYVFVPGATCYGEVKGLFGGSSKRLVSKGSRCQKIDAGHGPEAALLALAATARHAVAGINTPLPDLIVGHGVLGRLLARLVLVAGGPAPTVWDINPDRMSGAEGYKVIHPDDDPRRDYETICDVSGAPGILDQLMMRLKRGGEIVLAGFYTDPLSFAFPPAFMKEARIRVAAEWTPEDLYVTRRLVEEGDLSLAGLITHTEDAANATDAYRTAFTDAGCLKMILDWKGIA